MEENNVQEEVEEVVNNDEVEFLDPVEPIEIEEGMPDDVKEAIMRFNKRTSALRNVANSDTNSSNEEIEEDDDEYDDDEMIEEDEIEEESATNDVNIIEDDNTEELGDLF